MDLDLRKRSSRTRPDHQRVMLDYIEKHPEMMTHSFTFPDARKHYNENWRILTEILNAMGYGEKTTEQWQRVLTDWLSKLKMKWVTIKKDISGTGGGPGSRTILNEIEQRLLSLKGWSSVDGDGVTKEFGLGGNRDVNVKHPEVETSNEEMETFSVQFNEPLTATSACDNLQFDNEQDHNYFLIEDNVVNMDNTINQPINHTTSNLGFQKRSNPPAISESRKKKKNDNNYVSNGLLQQQHEEVMGSLQHINANLSRIGLALEGILECLKSRTY